MRNLRLIALAAAVAGGLSGAAQAAEPAGHFIHPADKNHDERIDRAEWIAYGLPAADFDKTDANHDKLISGPEFVAWDMARRAKGGS